MPRFHLRNGIRVQYTAEEETARDAYEAQAIINRKTRADAETAVVVKKASGKQKLKDLGLDDEEIKALIGI
jgi:hypothetical protein